MIEDFDVVQRSIEELSKGVELPAEPRVASGRRRRDRAAKARDEDPVQEQT
jgi:hypothetical protein